MNRPVNNESWIYRLKCILKARKYDLLIESLQRLKQFVKYFIYTSYQLIGKNFSINHGKLLLLAEQRSGGTSLLKIINEHPGFTFIDEPLIDFAKEPKALLEGMAVWTKLRGKAFGCKVKTWHITERQGIDAARDYLQKLIEDGWTVIHLHRENVAKQALANLYRYICKINNLDPKYAKVHIPVGDFLETISKLKDNSRRDMALAKDLSCLILSYERDILNLGGTRQHRADQVFKLLGLEPITVEKIKLETDSENFSEYIINHEEILNLIRVINTNLEDTKIINNKT